jgi:hypothetical protein
MPLLEILIIFSVSLFWLWYSLLYNYNMKNEFIPLDWKFGTLTAILEEWERWFTCWFIIF